MSKYGQYHFLLFVYTSACAVHGTNSPTIGLLRVAVLLIIMGVCVADRMWKESL